MVSKDDSVKFWDDLNAKGTPKSHASGKFNSLNPIFPAFEDIPLSLIVESTKRRKAHTELEPFDVTENGQDFMKRRAERRNIAKPDARQQHSQKFEMSEKVKVVKQEKAQGTVDLLKKTLRKHFVFNYMGENELDAIVSQFFYCELEKGNHIFEEGDDATTFFILETGTLEVFVNKVCKSKLSAGASLGELALLYNTPRNASVLGVEKCGLWGIDRHTFRLAVEEMIRRDLEANRQFIEKVAFFKNMTPEQKDGIAGILIKQKFEPGEYIVQDGDPADSFYIIKEGMVSVVKNEKQLRKLEEGDSFGENALLDSNCYRKFAVKTLTETTCLALGRETVNAILGDKVQAIAFRNLQRWAFERNPTLAKLTKIQIEKVLDEMKILKKDKGQFIFRKDQKCNKIVIPLEGNLIYLSSGETCVQKGMAYGEKYMLVEFLDEMIDDDIVMGESGILTEIETMDFIKVIGGPLPIVLKKNERSHERKISGVKEQSYCPEIPLENLIFITKIGSGQFGSVYLVEDSNTHNLYALKCISRNKIISSSLEKHLQEEKRVLQSMAFPFIVQFVRSYKDDINIYFLMEFVKGMELFDVIREIGLLHSEECQFYIGSMILAIEYMHGQDIVYRDIKPENVMGYLRLIDMGTCKYLQRTETGFPGRTFTIIGTPLYMAPEIIAGRGYSFYVDFWSIGVCLYEFMCGMVPFGEMSEDAFEIYEQILNKTVKYPPYLTDIKAKSLMDQLLSKIPEARWGGSFAALKSHECFEYFDWDQLLEREIEAPYLPDSTTMISQEEIEEARTLNVTVTERISMNTPKLNSKQKTVYSETKPGLQDWDKDF